MKSTTNLISTVKRQPVKAQLIDLSMHGLVKARSAQFHRLGGFLAVVPAEGAGVMFKTYNLYGDKAELKPMVMPETAAWESVAFNPGLSEPDQKSARPEVAVACGDEVVFFTHHSLLAGWEVSRRLPMPNASCVAYSQDGKVILAGSKDGYMKVWDNAEGRMEELLSAQVAESCITGIAVNYQNDVVYFSTADGDCFRFSGGDGPPATLKAADEREYGFPPEFEASSMACAPCHPHLVVGGTGSMVWFVNFDGDIISPLHTNLGGFVRKVSYLHKGCLALLGPDSVELWNALTMKRTDSFLVGQDRRALAVRCFLSTCYIVVS